MSPEQVIKCVVYLQASWPNIAWTEETTAQWADDLGGMDVEVARVVARKARDELMFPPTWAWFRQHASAELARRAPAVRALGEGAPVGGERAGEWIAEAREQIRQARGTAT